MFMGLLKKKRKNAFKNNISIGIMYWNFVSSCLQEENIEGFAHQFNSDDLLGEDLQPFPFPELGSNVLDGRRVSFASKWKLYGTFSSTYTEDEGLKCKLDIEFKSALLQDQNLISFADSLLTQPTSSPLPPLLIEEPATQDKIRERRIQYFNNQSATTVDVNDDNKIIRVDRMNVREDIMKYYLTEEVCIFWFNVSGNCTTVILIHIMKFCAMSHFRKVILFEVHLLAIYMW